MFGEPGHMLRGGRESLSMHNPDCALESCLWSTEELEVGHTGGSHSTFHNSAVGKLVPLLSASWQLWFSFSGKQFDGIDHKLKNS